MHLAMAINAININMGKYVQTGSAVSLFFYFCFNLALTLLNKLLLEKVCRRTLPFNPHIIHVTVLNHFQGQIPLPAYGSTCRCFMAWMCCHSPQKQ